MARLLKLMLMAVGAFTALKYGVIALVVLALGSADDSDVFVQVYPSPDGVYSAALVSRSGGGAISPFCDDRIMIFNSSLNVDEVVKESVYVVYSGVCDFFSNGDAGPVVHWESNREVRVDFSIGGALKRSRKVELKNYDASESVQVKFSAYR